MLEGRAHQRDIRLDRYLDDSLYVYGNGDRLYQLVMILGDNAMKYSPDSSVITFKVTQNPDQSTELTISDQAMASPRRTFPTFGNGSTRRTNPIPGIFRVPAWALPSAGKSSGSTRPRSKSKARWGREPALSLLSRPVTSMRPSRHHPGAEVVENVHPLPDDDTIEK